MPRLLPYIGPVVRLVSAAEKLPASWLVVSAVEAYYAGLAPPLAEITAQAVADAQPGAVAADKPEDLKAALAEVPTEKQTAVLALAETFASGDDGKLMVSAPAVGAVSPIVWEVISLLVPVVLDWIRKRRQS